MCANEPKLDPSPPDALVEVGPSPNYFKTMGNYSGGLHLHFPLQLMHLLLAEEFEIERADLTWSK